MAKYLIEMRPNANDRYLGEGDTMLGAIQDLVMLIIKNSFVDSKPDLMIDLANNLNQLSEHCDTIPPMPTEIDELF